MRGRGYRRVGMGLAGLTAILAVTAAGCAPVKDAGTATAIAKVDGTPLDVTNDGAYVLIETVNHEDVGVNGYGLAVKNLATSKVWTILSGEYYVPGATFTEDGRFVLYDTGGTIYRWDRTTQASVEVYGLAAGGSEYMVVGSSSNGAWALIDVVEAASSKMKLVNVQTLAITSLPGVGSGYVCGISNDGSRFALLSNDSLSVRSASTGALISGSKATPGITSDCGNGALSGDGKTLVFASTAASLPGGAPKTIDRTNVFTYSLVTGKYTRVVGEVEYPDLFVSDTGRYVTFGLAFEDIVGDGVYPSAYRFDATSGSTVRVTAKRRTSIFSANGAGTKIGYTAGDYIYLWSA